MQLLPGSTGRHLSAGGDVSGADYNRSGGVGGVGGGEKLGANGNVLGSHPQRSA